MNLPDQHSGSNKKTSELQQAEDDTQGQRLARLSLAALGVVFGDHPRMGRWRSGLFIFMSQNALDAAAYFDIPTDQVIEVGGQLQV